MIFHQRRICWPDPDATCLVGDCDYCNFYPFRSVDSLIQYARRVGMRPHRAGGQESAWQALQYGQRRGWPGVDQCAGRTVS